MNLYSRFVRLCALPWVGRVTQSQFWKLYRQLQQDVGREVYAPAPDVLLHRLQDLMRHAYHAVPFYRERMQSLGLPERFPASLDDFRQLPPTSKADITANFPDRITSSEQEYRPWRYVSTSGTVERLTVIQDFRKRDYVRAAALLSSVATGYQPGLKYMEIPPNICANVCGVSETAEPQVFRYFLENLKAKRLKEKEVISDLRGLVERQLLYRRVQLASFGSEGLAQPAAELEAYLQKIDAYQPYVLKALPTYLYLLAHHLLAHKMRPPRIHGAIMPMGASMTPYMKGLIQTAFACPVHEDYGCAELGAMATECQQKRGLHPFAGLFHIEVVREGQPVGDGEVGKVLVTDLWNYAMPLIRYDIGDVALVRREPCACGLPGDRIEVLGRVQDSLRASDGEIIPHDWVVDALLARPEVLGFQFELSREDKGDLQVVPATTTEVPLDELAHSLSKSLWQTPTISARIVPTILPESSGKYRFVKNSAQDLCDLY